MIAYDPWTSAADAGETNISVTVEGSTSVERSALPDARGAERGAPLGGVTVNLADVVPERVDWLWFGRLPLGKIVVLDGDPSVGKSTLAVDCAARVSTGHAWPDGAPNRRGAVLLLSAEDGLADTIRPRLDAASGDPSGVDALTEVRYRDEHNVIRTRPATLADLDDIEDAVRRTKAVLVVVDVLMAFLPGKVDSHRDQDVRGVLSGLAAMAERNTCCILLLRHLNKSAGGSAMYRGGGSIGIIGAARVGLLAAVDPEDESRRVLAGIKSNLAVMPEALAYQLVDSPEHGCARVDWLGVSGHTAGVLLAGPRDEDERTERDEAGEWLLDYLAGNEREALSGQIKKAAHGEGISERTLKRAKAKMRVGHYSTKTKPRRTYWTHPELQSGQSGQNALDTQTVAQLGQGGPTAETQGVQSGQLVQLGQLGHAVSAGLTDDPPPVLSVPGCSKHPGVPINTANGKCPRCILEALAAKTAAAGNCTACGYPLDPVIVAEGQDTHPGCDLDDVNDQVTAREGESA